MWQKHPIVRLIVGLVVVLVTATTLISAFLFWPDFWQDGQRPPSEVEGVITTISNRQAPSTMPGHFKLTTATGQVLEFDLRNTLLNGINQYYLEDPGTKVKVSFSPALHSVYTVEVITPSANNPTYVQDSYEPGQLFQKWQRIPVYILAGVFFIGLAALIYVIFAMLDLCLPVQKVQGALVGRIERADTRSDGYSIVVRPWNIERPGKQLQYELGQAAFLATDGIDFVEVISTRLFHYVRRVRQLDLSELPSEARASLIGLSNEGMRLSYQPGWRLRAFLYSDGLFSLALFVVALFIIFGYLPEWSNPQRAEPPQWLLVPMLAILAFTMAIYLLLRFRRKLQDLSAPKRIAQGPVLSKWRVTGTSNDNRRLIVIADGGLSAGEKAVCKFDLSPALFDQLRVGDIVEIEHTPRLRYICRLEVKGHQELTSSYQV